MNINNIEQMVLNFDEDLTIENVLHIKQPKIEFNFEQLFSEPLTEKNKNNNASLVILGDNISVLRKIKDKSVQLIFADAPYSIGKDFGNNVFYDSNTTYAIP